MIGKWRVDEEQTSIDRWIMPLSKESDKYKCLDFQYDAYGGRMITIIDRDLSWLSQYTKPIESNIVYRQSGIDESFLIAYVFEEL